MGYDDYDQQVPQRPAGMNPVLIVVIVVAILFGGCAVVSVIAAIAIPNLISARQAGNEAAAVGGLKSITMAQTLFREADKDADGVEDYGTLGELGSAQLVDEVLASGIKQGYRFSVKPGPDPEVEWSATAVPTVPGTTGSRHFYVDQTGAIYHSSQPIQGPVDPQSPPPGVQLFRR